MSQRIYQENDLILEEADGKAVLFIGNEAYELSDSIRDSNFYIRKPDRKWLSIYHAFSVKELCRAALENEPIKIITGNTYDIRGVLKLIRKAIELSRDDADIGYIEGQCFMDLLRERGAVSYETAVDPAQAGISNPRIMNPFIHSNKVNMTAYGLFYIPKPGEGFFPTGNDSGAASDEENSSRLISNQVRFGVGYRQTPSGRQYYAWHGYPNRNDDFITYAEISKDEFFRINREYPGKIEADRDTAEVFRRKYVNGHKVIKEGWNISLK
ncbi:MAG: hypothetical protein J5379_00345 [Clostridiales bacterium]|nr:hypothetical protein [Clostridiales bacterium]